MLEMLKSSFVTAGEPYREGAVAVLEQKIKLDPEEKIDKAVLMITALGIFEAELDGKKLGEEYFAPGYTYYPRELQYQKTDITKELEKGGSLRVYLAQGWYCGRFTFDNKTQIYGENAAVSWVLTVEGSKGTHIYTSADDTVQLLESPYEYAGFYDGEVYHGKGALAAAGRPKPYEGPLPEVFMERFNAVRLRERMPVKSVQRNGSTTILDFGQNFAGIVCIDPAKMKGDRLKLRHGEILNADGSLYTNNLRKAKAEIVYYKEKEKTIYRPRFTYMGFRYVELTGVEYEEGLITAYALYSEMERTGFFECENERVAQLYSNQLWGQKSNYVEVPTDCPQRDERMGYTGDGHVFARTGTYNYDTRSFWRKFLADIRYSQMDNPEGYIPSTVPAQGPAGIGFLNMLGWGNAVTLIPELLYEQYGDESFLTDQYESIKKFVNLECKKCKLLGLWLGANLGDWLMMGKDLKYMAAHNGPVSNSFIVHDLKVAAGLAGKLGYTEDAERYERQYAKTVKAYKKHFIKKDGKMTDDYQGAYVMALKWVLDPEEDEELYRKVYSCLIGHLKQDGMQTGFFATQHLLPLLAENGDRKLAIDILLQPECPGWMYQVDRGATTTWERWDALRPDGTVNESKMSDDNMVSFNHYAFGSVGEFYYGYILGIKPRKPGYEEISLCPIIDRRLGNVKGSYTSVKGKISVAWEFTEKGAQLSVTTPAKTFLTLPDSGIQVLEPGDYTYEIKLD